MTTDQMVKLVIPLLFLEFTLKGISLYSIIKGNPKHLPKLAWVLIVIAVSTIGPICYLVFGRGEEKYDD